MSLFLLEIFWTSIILGLVFFSLYFHSSKDKKEDTIESNSKMKYYENRLNSIILEHNIKKGNQFEDHVRSLFDSYFTIQPRTQKYPDYIITFNPNRDHFAVECKWKKQLYNNSYNINEREFRNYKNYHFDNNIPFFMVLGLGGTAANPEQIFIVPLNRLKYPDIKKYYLDQFEKRNKNKPFSYNSLRKKLY
ncbi:MAG: hypothetical protein O8C61_05570 [Candidatus Methanoperedens sp.]|nr:hypothetical protein [Candidatus Methanoperedens sp.]